MEKFKAFLQRVGKSGNLVGSAMSLESIPLGIRYKEAKGIESKGKIKDVYTENYAEADGVRSFHPSDIDSSHETHRESTTVELTLVFTGNGRREKYQTTYDFMRSYRLYYWDSYRKRVVYLMMQEATEPDEDVLKGTPYILVKFKFINLWGYAKTAETVPNAYINLTGLVEGTDY